MRAGTVGGVRGHRETAAPLMPLEPTDDGENGLFANAPNPAIPNAPRRVCGLDVSTHRPTYGSAQTMVCLYDHCSTVPNRRDR
jgi:hypothetical protein